MKEVIWTEQKPIKLWLDDIEAGALEQAKNLARGLAMVVAYSIMGT